MDPLLLAATLFFGGSLLGFLLLYLFLGKEGRYFFNLSMNKKGISFINLSPSGELTLKKLKWDGERYIDGKEAIYFSFDQLNNEDREDEVTKYNDVLKRTAFWSGTKVPVLMGYDMACFAANPHLVPLLEISIIENEKLENMKKILESLKDGLSEKISRVSFELPMNISRLHEFLDVSTSAYQYESFEKGRAAGRYEMTKPKRDIPLKQLILPAAAIIMIIILLSSGVFNDLLKNLGLMK